MAIWFSRFKSLCPNIEKNTKKEFVYICRHYTKQTKSSSIGQTVPEIKIHKWSPFSPKWAKLQISEACHFWTNSNPAKWWLEPPVISHGLQQISSRTKSPLVTSKIDRLGMEWPVCIFIIKIIKDYTDGTKLRWCSIYDFTVNVVHTRAIFLTSTKIRNFDKHFRESRSRNRFAHDSTGIVWKRLQHLRFAHFPLIYTTRINVTDCLVVPSGDARRKKEAAGKTHSVANEPHAQYP